MKKISASIVLSIMIMQAAALNSAPPSTMGLTASSSFIEFVNGVPVKQSTSLGSLSLKNTGTMQLKVRLDALKPEPGDVPPGYQPLSELSWVSFSKNEFYLNPGEKTSVGLRVKPAYGGGKYKAYIWSHTINDGATQIGTILPLTFSVQPGSVKATGTNFFFPPSKIGVRGNKFVVKLEIYSDGDLECALYYRKIGASSYNKVSMPVTSESEGIYFSKAEIPAYLITPPGIEYYIEMITGGTTSLIPDTAPSVPFRLDVDCKTCGKVPKKGGKLSVPDANPDDGETSIDIPQGALLNDIDLTINQLDNEFVPRGYSGPMLTTSPVMAFEFLPEGTSFRKPAKMSMLYFDQDDDGKVDGTEFNDSDLKLFWWDGYEWRLVGGTLDRKNKIISVNVSHFSLYALFPVGPLSADDYRPKEKIITPAYRDGVNDFAAFGNLSGSDFEINIYDITGRLVRQLSDDSFCGPNWDGTDEYNNVVESGIYIYQFKADINGSMKLVSGTIAVAK
ncbi:MAG: gliding motility-associated C-terminal domain-containing protein [Elusimicrobiota bacterium]